MLGVVRDHLQAVYAGLKNSLQQDCEFVQRATQGLGHKFRPVEKALREEFLPDLFFGVEVHMTGWTIMGFLVKYAGIEIPEPNQTAQGNWTTLCMVTSYPIASLYVRVELRSRYHALLLTNNRTEN